MFPLAIAYAYSERASRLGPNARRGGHLFQYAPLGQPGESHCVEKGSEWQSGIACRRETRRFGQRPREGHCRKRVHRRARPVERDANERASLDLAKDAADLHATPGSPSSALLSVAKPFTLPRVGRAEIPRASPLEPASRDVGDHASTRPLCRRTALAEICLVNERRSAASVTRSRAPCLRTLTAYLKESAKHCFVAYPAAPLSLRRQRSPHATAPGGMGG